MMQFILILPFVIFAAGMTYISLKGKTGAR